MRRWRKAAVMSVFALFAVTMGQAQEAPMPVSFISALEWSAYQAQFVAESGRVIDTANGNISHSEGQGYGLLLAFLAQDRAAFEKIWSFTRTELMVRDDGLAAWRWDADKSPHITDSNNATDGDILIAYALALAGEGWGETDKASLALSMIKTIDKSLLVSAEGKTIILPGTVGFTKADREDGPVINLSYWIFEAFPLFARLAPATNWSKVSDAGRELVVEAQFGEAALPTDWVSLADAAPKPADNFAPEYSYNSIRIPLYLLRAGFEDGKELASFQANFSDKAGGSTVNVQTDAVVDRLNEPGYRIIGAAINCALSSSPVPNDLKTFSVQSYFGSTLHLLTLDYLRKRHSACLSGATG